MSGVKISALPAVGSAQVTDIFPVVQGGVTSQETVTQLNTLLGTVIQLSSASQVTGLPGLLSGYLPLAGGTMTGNLFLNANPSVPLQAATKAYVDTVASGFTVILACQAATTANLNATQAGAGIGATLTNAGAMAAFSVDGYSASLNDRILVKNQTATQHNGIYSVTTLGSGAANWVLTRTIDYDTAAQIKPGTLVAVNNGTVNATTSWLETATVVTVDTDPVLFSQFTFAPAQFLQVANNLSDVANVATSRTNLGLGTAATKASSSSDTTVASVHGSITNGNLAKFNDISGTVADSGITSTTTGSGVVVLATSPVLTSPTASSLAFSPTTSGIIGTTTNDSANTGIVGQYLSSVILIGAAVNLTTNVAANITSIPLTAGDYDAWGEIWIGGTTGAIVNNIIGCITTTSATVASVPADNTSTSQSGSITDTIGTQVIPILPIASSRISLAAPATLYLVASVLFTTQPVKAYGKICVRRRR